ncbi:MAG: protein kinase [Acidobacteriota bacterium]
MSPEQIQGQAVDHRADIFSLGVMFYELLTGKKPFFGENLSAVTHRIVFGDFTPVGDLVPGLPPAVTEVLNRALAKDPAERYDRGGDMATDLRAVFAPPPSASTPPSGTRTSSFLAEPSAISPPPTAPSPTGTPAAASAPAAAPGPTTVAAPATAAAAVPSPVAAPASSAVPPAAPAAGAANPPAESSSSVAMPPSNPPGATPFPPGTVPSAAAAPVPPQTAPAPPVAAPAVTQPTGAYGSGTFASGTFAPEAATGSATAEAKGKSFLAKPSTARVALAAALVVAIGLVVVGVARLSVREEEAPQRDDPELQRQVEVLPFLKRGREHLDAGQPSAALEAFERAAAIAPDDREIRRWRDRAERAILESDGVELEEAFVSERLDAGRASLNRRDYPAAIRLAQEVLEVDPENADGKDLLRQAEDGQRRREDMLARQRAQAPPPPRTTAASPSVETGSVQTPAVAAEATLTINFASKISEGRLTIFNGQEKILQQPFKFVSGKSGLLRRARKTSGSLQQRLTLPSGDLDLRVYVWRKGSTTKTAEIKGNLPPGSARALQIEVSDEGRVSVRLE